jgi:hypothetical protein
MIPVPRRLEFTEAKLVRLKITRGSMAKYRMDIFKPGRKPGHPAPMLWRRRDIYASDDAAAKAEAEDLYRTHSSQRTLTNFYLCDSGGRTIYESLRRDPD